MLETSSTNRSFIWDAGNVPPLPSARACRSFSRAARTRGAPVSPPAHWRSSVCLDTFRKHLDGRPDRDRPSLWTVKFLVFGGQATVIARTKLKTARFSKALRLILFLPVLHFVYLCCYGFISRGRQDHVRRFFCNHHRRCMRVS